MYTGRQSGLIPEGKYEIDPVDLIQNFTMYKGAPILTTPLELLRGKTLVGEERTPLETIANTIKPMVLEDVVDAYEIEGLGRAFWVGPLNAIGTSTNTYKKRRQGPRGGRSGR